MANPEGGVSQGEHQDRTGLRPKIPFDHSVNMYRRVPHNYIHALLEMLAMETYNKHLKHNTHT